VFSHLLCPLDGSRLAEAALPVAAYLAEQAGARVTLLHVLERGAPATIHGDRHLQDQAEAEAYLRETKTRAFAPGARVDWHVHDEPPRTIEEGLLAHVRELGCNMFVMCTHGRVRVRDRLWGNMAQRIIRERIAPVLLLTPRKSGVVPMPFRKILVPLDGDPEHEHGLAQGAFMARLCDASITLLSVVPTSGVLKDEDAITGTFLPNASEEMCALKESQAVAYLQTHVGRLCESGSRASGSVTRGDPARCITACVKDTSADLVVLGTHGKAGTTAFWSGSLTPRLLRRVDASFLLAPHPRD
jgi:nucleotide-binding universal stress UspA family protein